MNLGFSGNSDITKYALVAYKTNVAALKSNETANPEPQNTQVSNDEYVSSGTQSRGDYTKLVETLLHGKSYNREEINDLNQRLNSDEPELQAAAGEEYKALSNLYIPQSVNLKNLNLNTPENFQDIYNDADGFMYIAGRGLVPWSNNGVKYPTEEALQKEADQALKDYLAVAVPVSAENLLSQIQATGKEPTAEEQMKIAELLKQEIASGSLSREEVKAIKSKLSDAYTSLIPEESAEHEALRKEIKTLMLSLTNPARSDFAINSAWLNATFDPETEFQNTLNGQATVLNDMKYQMIDNKELNQRRQNGFSIAYLPSEEEAFINADS